MGFYQELSKYYDDIFPPEKGQVDFIAASIKSEGRVLDVACGSGGYSAELYKKGLKVYACDLDDGMVQAARKRFQEGQMGVSVEKVDMTELSKIYSEKFDGVFCIGNSIVHLGNIEQIKKAASEMRGLLVVGGSLILQTMNFDRVRKYNIKELPEIKALDGQITFKRYYSNLENGKIAFDTELQVQEKESMKNRVELLPLYKKELSDILINLGFKDICFYGDFNNGSYKDDSYVLVVKAKK